MNKPIIIGLTGPTGAGKSTVAIELCQQGCSVIDCDLVARDVTNHCGKCVTQLRSEFGEDIVDENGSLNRRMLAQRAFSSEKKSHRLNEITHPFILAKVNDKIAALHDSGVTTIVVDAPLLFESGADTICNVIIAVTAPLDIRLSRIMHRDNINMELAVVRTNAQHSDDYYTKRADYCIDGTKGFEQIAKQIKDILENIAGGVT